MNYSEHLENKVLELEEILDSKNIKIQYVSVSHSKTIKIKFCGNYDEKRKISLRLRHLGLNLDRGTEYFAKSPDKTSYEISSTDGPSNEIMSRYYHKHSKQEGNPFESHSRT